MKSVKITTPTGTAVWPKLNEPDRKFQPEGVYEVKLRLPENEAEALIEKIMDVHASAYREACSAQGKKALKKAPVPWGPAEQWNSDTETKEELPGFIDFKFKMKAKVTSRSGKSWEQRPALFDAQLNPIPEDSDPIGGGSVIRISAEVYPWHAASMGFGISLRPKAVQVIELKTYSGSNDDHGFDKKDGFTVKSSSPFDDEGDDQDF